MEDAELDILMEEVKFRTPNREATENTIKEEKVKSDDVSKGSQLKKVLINDSVMMKSERDEPLFKESTYDAFEAMLNESGSDDDKKSLGTSNRFTKKHRITMIEKPNSVCGRVLSQGVAFCLNKNCTINHRTEGFMELEEGQLYVI